MLSEAIQFIKKQVEEFLQYKGNSSESMLRLGSLSGINDAKKDESESNLIRMSIVNIEEAESMANRMPRVEKAGIHEKRNPAVYLNVYLLFSMDFQAEHYSDGLNWLSLVIQFFQQHMSFNESTTAMPSGLSKLNFELVNIEIDNMSRFWGALGANYQPSVIYRMRMIMIDGEAVEAELAGIHQPEVNTGL